MTSDDKYYNEAKGRLAEFEAGFEPDRLREAYLSLENVIPANELDEKHRALLRIRCLSLWLQLIQILDSLRDQHFDPGDVPNDLVQPPPTTGGVVCLPGADPALIADPEARAEYEKAIAANRKKIENYRMQLHLSRLSERIPQRAEEFIKRNYAHTATDEAELEGEVKKIIKNPQRREHLLDVLKQTPTR